MNQFINPKSKLFYHNDRLAAIKNGERPAPVNVEIDLSNRCSLGCAWCLTRTAILDILGRGKCCIADVRPGDYVLAYNETFGTLEWSEVYAVSERDTSEIIYRIVVGDNIIEATGNHRIFTRRGWVEARHLTIFDEVAHVSKIMRLRVREPSEIGSSCVPAGTQCEGWSSQQYSDKGLSPVQLRVRAEGINPSRGISSGAPEGGSSRACLATADRVATLRLRVRSTSEDEGCKVLPGARTDRGDAAGQQRAHESQQPDATTGHLGKAAEYMAESRVGQSGFPEDERTSRIGGITCACGCKYSRTSSQTIATHDDEQSHAQSRNGCDCSGEKFNEWSLSSGGGTDARTLAEFRISPTAIKTHEGKQPHDGCGSTREIAVQNTPPFVPIKARTVVQSLLSEIPISCSVHGNGRILGQWPQSRLQDSRSQVRDRSDGRLFENTGNTNDRELCLADNSALSVEWFRVPSDNAAIQTPESHGRIAGEFGDSNSGFFGNWQEQGLEFQEIDDIALTSFDGKVYNLETSTGTYFANDMLVHNCHFAYTHTRGPLAGKHDKPAGHIDGGDLMDTELAMRILYQLQEAGVKSVTWTGGGEPTLHPHFCEIVQYAAGQGLEQGMYTHGGHIDDRKAHTVKQSFEWVYVSLDECTAEDYKRSKGVDRFDAVLSGICRLSIASGRATVGVGFLLHTGNVDNVDHMVHLGRKLGVDYVQFRPIIHYHQDAPNQQIDDVFWINRAINNLRKHAGDKFVQADISRFERYQNWHGHDYPTCYWSALQTVITPNGKVWRCTNKREHPDALLGDLSEESFDTLWKRSGGPCAVTNTCRIACRGDIPNQTLDAIMTEPVHANFI